MAGFVYGMTPMKAATFFRVWIYRGPVWISHKIEPRRAAPADGPGGSSRKLSRRAAPQPVLVKLANQVSAIICNFDT